MNSEWKSKLTAGQAPNQLFLAEPFLLPLPSSGLLLQTCYSRHFFQVAAMKIISITPGASLPAHVPQAPCVLLGVSHLGI